MTNYYVFVDEQSALAAVEQINSRGREVFTLRGYVVDLDGSVVGERFDTEQSDASSQHTTTWDIPRATLLGTWVVLSPEHRVRSDIELQPGQTLAQYVVQDLTAPLQADPNDGTWFAKTALPVPE